MRFVGEEGKVEESMKELEAVEALKAEKTEKEVRKSLFWIYSGC